MSQQGVFAVANFAITTASASSANEARSRALALYRKFQKDVKYSCLAFNLELNYSCTTCFSGPRNDEAS